MNKGLKVSSIPCPESIPYKRNTDLMNKGLKDSLTIHIHTSFLSKRNTDLMNKGLKDDCSSVS